MAFVQDIAPPLSAGEPLRLRPDGTPREFATLIECFSAATVFFTNAAGDERKR